MNTLILENTEDGEFPIDVYQKLSNNRILFVYNNITDQVAADLVATLFLKDAESPEEKITLFINSTGGDIRNVLMIYDVMQLLSSPIQTVCVGSAMDEAVILLAGGTPGMRFATKNSNIVVGQLVHDWIMQADLTNAKKILDLYVKDNKRMMDILAEHTGKSVKEVMIDFERRVFLDAKQALKYKLIDKVVKFQK